MGVRWVGHRVSWSLCNAVLSGIVARYLYGCHVDLRRTCTALGAFG